MYVCVHSSPLTVDWDVLELVRVVVAILASLTIVVILMCVCVCVCVYVEREKVVGLTQ